MSFRNLNTFNRPGLQSVGQYQMSGRSWMSGSTIFGANPNNGEILVTFPQVTKAFTVINLGPNQIWVHLDTRSNANVVSQNHYISIDASASFNFPTKNKQIYISTSGSTGTGSFQIHAELTGLHPSLMFNLTGSGVNEI